MLMQNNIKSFLEMKNLFFPRMQVINTKRIQENQNLKLINKIKYYKNKENSNFLTIKIITKIEFENNILLLELECEGTFELKDTDNSLNEEQKKYILQRNTVAIMYPFIRSQISLLTTQPGMMPIIIPPIDINALVEQNENNFIEEIFEEKK